MICGAQSQGTREVGGIVGSQDARVYTLPIGIQRTSNQVHGIGHNQRSIKLPATIDSIEVNIGQYPVSRVYGSSGYSGCENHFSQEVLRSQVGQVQVTRNGQRLGGGSRQGGRVGGSRPIHAAANGIHVDGYRLASRCK